MCAVSVDSRRGTSLWLGEATPLMGGWLWRRACMFGEHTGACFGAFVVRVGLNTGSSESNIYNLILTCR